MTQHKLIIILLVAFALASCSGKGGQQDASSSEIVALHDSLSKAHQYQKNKNYAEAIDIYKQIVSIDGETKIPQDSLLPIVATSMMQLMNSYQCIGKPDECVAYFDSLRQNPTRFIGSCAKRDLYIISAYATSRTDSMAQAESLADSALAMPLKNPTHDRLFRDYAYAAAVFFPNLNRQKQVVELSRKAIDEAKKDGNTSGAQYVTSMLGMIYRRSGQLPEAIDLYLESLKTAERKGDEVGQATACNMLVDFYLYWHLPHYADIYASKAVELNEAKSDGNPMVYTQSLLLKGQSLDAMGKRDSAIVYYKIAENTCDELPYTSGMADVDYYIGRYLVNNSQGNSFSEGMNRLKKVTKEGTALLRAKAYYAMAEGYMSAKEMAHAEALLDSMYNILHSFTPTQYIDIDYKSIINHYASKGDMKRTSQYAADLAATYSAEANHSIRSRMYETIVNLKTKSAHQQMDIKEMKMQNERLYWRIWLIVSVGVIVLLSVVIVYRRRITNAKRIIMEKKLSLMLDRLEKAKKEKENAEYLLSTITQKIQQPESDNEVDIPVLLKDEGVEKFRSQFERLYPNFLSAIRLRVGNLSRNEEIHCMLIYLGQDIHQTSSLLGIAYRSVNMARYRLRKKFELDGDQTLEEVIKQINT